MLSCDERINACGYASECIEASHACIDLGHNGHKHAHHGRHTHGAHLAGPRASPRRRARRGRGCRAWPPAPEAPATEEEPPPRGPPIPPGVALRLLRVAMGRRPMPLLRRRRDCRSVLGCVGVSGRWAQIRPLYSFQTCKPLQFNNNSDAANTSDRPHGLLYLDDPQALLDLLLMQEQRPAELPVSRAMRGLPPRVEPHQVVVDVHDA